jgi:hypothetical protein
VIQGAAAQAYVIANIVIGLGYLAIPALVLPYWPIRRRTMIAGVVFFLGCFGTHVGMSWDLLRHPEHMLDLVTWTDAGWHIVQAIGTWGFILLYREELAAAKALLDQAEGIARERPDRTDG